MAAYNNIHNNRSSRDDTDNTARQSSPISQYLDGLNMIPSATSSTFDAETTLFPGNQYFDFDISQPLPAFPAGIDHQSNDAAAAAAAYGSRESSHLSLTLRTNHISR